MFLSSCIFCSLTPRIKFFSCKEVLGRMYTHGIRAIPASSVAGGEEDVGEKGQGSCAHLGVVRVGSGKVGGSGSTAEQRRRKGSSKSGELRRARAGAARLESFFEGRGRGDGVRPGQCRGGGGSSARRRASPVMEEEAVVNAENHIR